MPKVIIDKAIPNWSPDFVPPVTEGGEVPTQLSAQFRGQDRLTQVQYAGEQAFLTAEIAGTNDLLQTGSLVIVQSTQATSTQKGVLYTSDEVEGRARPLEEIRARLGLAGTPAGRIETANIAGGGALIPGFGAFPGIVPQILSDGLVTWGQNQSGAIEFKEHGGYLEIHFSGSWSITAQPIDIEILLQRYQSFSATWEVVREFAAFTLSTTNQVQANWSADNLVVSYGVPYRILIKRTDGGPAVTINWREPSIDWKLSVD